MQERRVGTITLGALFIFMGISAVLAIFLKESVFYFLRFAPILLIILGVEVLIYSIRYKEQVKLRYDGLAMFFLITVSIVSVGCYSVSQVGSRYISYRREYLTQTDNLTEKIENIIDQNSLNGSVTVCNSGGYSFDQFIYDNYYNQDSSAVISLFDFEKNTSKDDIAEKLSGFIKDMSSFKDQLQKIEIDLCDTHDNPIYLLSFRTSALNNIDISTIKDKIRLIDSE